MTLFLQSFRELPLLCQGRPQSLKTWLENPTAARLWACAAAILLGCGAYGFTLGLWRAPLMGGFVAVKLPLLVFATLLTNGLLNGMLAQVLGSGLGFRQTVLAMLMSFASFSLITAALSPVALMMVLDAPGPGEPGAGSSHATILVVHVAIIAFAGVTAHRRFFPVLASASETPGAGLRVFLAWLAGNLFVGAQLSWNLRPFFGHPGKDVAFLREDWNHGTFYEAVFDLVKGLIGPVQYHPAVTVFVFLCLIILVILIAFRLLRLFSIRS